MERLLNKLRLLLWPLLAFVGMLFILPGCKSTRHLPRLRPKEASFETLYGQMLKHQPDFSYYNAKLTVNYKKGSHWGSPFKAQLRIRKDSLIWGSIVPAMGIEAARVEITRDSVKLLNRMKKKFTAGSYSMLDSLLHAKVNYQLLQALLLGTDIKSFQAQTGSSSVDKGLYKISMHRQVAVRAPGAIQQSGNEDLIQTIWLYPSNFRIRKILVKETKGESRGLEAFYDQYQEINGQLLPTRIQIRILSKQKLLIELLIKRLNFNKPRGFPFAVPSNYVKL